jgi:hypothetical protein
MASDPRWPDGGVHHGIEEFQAFMARFLEAFDGIRFEEVRDAELSGDWGIFHGKWVGHGAASGLEAMSFEFTVLFREREGLITEARFFFNPEEGREYARSPT